MPALSRPRLLRPATAALVTIGSLALAACDGAGADAALREQSAGAIPGADAPSVAHDLAGRPEAMSLLGEPLFPILPDSATHAAMIADLDSAEAAYEADADDADALIWVGRRLGYLGRYEGAIQAFTEGIERHPDDARFYRHRGHRYISVRQLDRAIEDLEHAARLISGRPDRIEPDGQPNAAGVPRSTLHTNVWYHLGLARYVAGDLEGAAHAFRRGYEISPNDDMRVAMADWLWLALVRLGREQEAGALLHDVLADSLDILENHAYERRLRLYAGQLAPADLLPPDADALAVATYGYGLGTWHLVRGDTTAARAIYDDLLAIGYWPAFGHLAAEAEIARMEGDGSADTP